MFTKGQSYQLGKYQLTITQNLLSEAHHGHEVYLASAASGQNYVLKFSTTPLATQQLHHEHSILQTLQGIAGIPQTQVVSAVHEPTQPQLQLAHIVQYMEHRATLAQYLRFQPTLLQQNELLPAVLDWFKQIVQILAAVHERGIIHGDLKLQNCLLNSAGRITIVDWDHGRFVGKAYFSTTIEGTPPYMAPEHLQGQTPDQRCDIYTLGMMHIALLYGSLLTPLYARSHGQAQRRHKTDIVATIIAGETAKYDLYPVPRSPAEAQLQAIWQRMTAPNAKQRFQTMAEIVPTLQPLL